MRLSGLILDSLDLDFVSVRCTLKTFRIIYAKNMSGRCPLKLLIWETIGFLANKIIKLNKYNGTLSLNQLRLSAEHRYICRKLFFRFFQKGAKHHNKYFLVILFHFYLNSLSRIVRNYTQQIHAF